MFNKEAVYLTQYNVTGMSCAACSARVEKAVNAVAGVESCAVSLLTNSMGVEGDVDPAAVIKAVTDAGYGASLKGAERADAGEEPLADTETPKLVRRLIASAVLLLVLMYFSMGHMMWGWPVPAFFDGNHIGLSLLQMLLAGIIMIINGRFFISGGKALLHRAPNMDTLVAMGSGVSFIWSVVMLFAMTGAESGEAMHELMMQLYFESAAMILTLITVGKTLEARAKGKTTDALKGLMKLAPKTAIILENEVEREVPAAQVQPGTVFVVRPGASIPADGIVRTGAAAVDESALTGESIPVDKAPGDAVSAGTVNKSGYLTCEATKTGEDTALSQIIRMVGDAAATKAPIAKLADKVSGVFVPTVLGIALVTFIVWMLLGQSVSYALARGVSVLVISCPCALGLATPVAITVANGVGAKHGILYKTAAALEETGRVQTVVLDKTGTVTQGEPTVTDLLPCAGVSETELLTYAASLERFSEHPLGRAVTEYAQQRGISLLEAGDFRSEAGAGVSAAVAGVQMRGCSGEAAAAQCTIPEDLQKQADTFAESGKTPLWFLRNGKLFGIIAVADVIKPDSAFAVAELKTLGLGTVMLTGDNERTAAAIGRQAGTDRVIAGVRPDGKEQVIRELAEQGAVCMVGDGINDAPALTRADVGMAIGTGTDIAVDAADVVLMQPSLTGVLNAVRLSRAALRNIKQNLFWAFCYNLIGIPLAAGVLVPFGLTLNPMFGAAAMSLSSFCVVTNALRLNLFRPVTSPETADVRNNTIETIGTKGREQTMTTLEIKGMMCPHCEAHVKKSLENIAGVTVQSISHESGTAVVETAGAVDEAAFRAAVTDAGYELTAIR